MTTWEPETDEPVPETPRRHRRPSSQWTLPIGLAVGIPLIAAGGYGLFHTLTSNGTPRVAGDVMGAQLSQQLTAQAGTTITVTCPSNQPATKGTIVDCTADDGTDRKIMRVTFDDNHGHYTAQLTSQDAVGG